MVISAKNLVAKARNKDKMIERLTLKLRASEEMRLQLKLEKSDLRKELLELQTHLQKQATANAEQDGTTMDNPHSPSEVGELTDSINNANNAEINNTISFCANCKLSLDIPDEANQVVATTELKYRDVLDENDTLRAGMMEILEKLREYDAASDHITIDTEMLYRLLEALRTSSVPGTPKRLENELKGLKAREEALQALIREQTQSHDQRAIDTDELCSVESIREGGEHNGFDDLSIHLPKPLDSSTRPTTPNKVLKQNELVMETNDQLILEIGSNNLKQTLEELEIYRKGFEDLQAQLKASETELAKQCATLSAQLITTQLALKKESNSYAFMREEYDNTLSRCKENELRHINEVSSLQNAWTKQSIG
ncbi:unnamed protein product [Ceratitis capitata]|uniref:(Mediterranean fruit fly) hypothetical protein n=1 Tax=Ceratitis capitata TaxID=7213 RepID=A0A811UY52_CERCA|nr:unnamed protein product [Ceratitis capitata]